MTVLEWPARSPDLSPIEHIWADIDRLLMKKPVTNLVDLETQLKRYRDEKKKIERGNSLGSTVYKYIVIKLYNTFIYNI